jgi:hypothetical protein
MKFFGDLVSALERVAGDEVNIGAELESLKAAEAAFEANVQAQVTAAITAQLGGLDPTAIAKNSSDIVDLQTRVTAIENDETAADGTLVPPATPLTITPVEADFVAGTASEVALTIVGGTGPYTASGLPAGVTFDGANLSADATAVAGTTSATISDASTPAVVGTVSVVVAAAA